MVKKKTVYVNYVEHLPQSCGITELGYFRTEAAHIWSGNTTLDNLEVEEEAPGAGWFLASFTPAHPIFKEAYNQLAEKYKIVYQSPVRVNTRTGRQFFFCIYDAKSKP